MARPIVLGNNKILVCYDNNGYLRDFYYPYVGLENHVNGNIHYLGFFINNQFSWLADSQWEKTLTYKEDSLVSSIHAINKNLGIEITIEDVVHSKHNILIKQIKFKNLDNNKKSIKVFFHQKFEISQSNIGDTAYYHPDLNCIITYKGKRYFLANAQLDLKDGISDFAVGLAGEYGKEGTFRDCEDGILSKNTIEHGLVDSTIALEFILNESETKNCSYWICVGEKFDEVNTLNKFVKTNSPSKLIEETQNYWEKIVCKTCIDYDRILPENIFEFYKRSILITLTHIDQNGSIIASGDSDLLYFKKDTYAYMWPRDGTLISRALDRSNNHNFSEKFFYFCKTAITKEGYLFHKYRPDGSLGSSWHPWFLHAHKQLPFQEDQLALVIYAMWKHYSKYPSKKFLNEMYEGFIKKASDFIYKFIHKKLSLPRESYDLWEEKLGIHTFTVSTIYASLIAISKIEKIMKNPKRQKEFKTLAEKLKEAILKNLYNQEKGYFIKGLYYDDYGNMHKDETLDISSFYSIFEFEVLDINDPRVQNNFKIIEEKLKNNKYGGYIRYENDKYFQNNPNEKGNPWILTTLWIAEYHITKAKTIEELKKAKEIFEWVMKNASSTGTLPEQIDATTGKEISVSPLIWSHASFIIAVSKYLNKHKELTTKNDK